MGENRAQQVCTMAPLRNLSKIIAIERKGLTIMALAVVNVVIKGLREISVTCRKVAFILDNGRFSNDHVAPVDTKGVGVGYHCSPLLWSYLGFEDIRFLFQFLEIIVNSILDRALDIVVGAIR